MSLFYVLCVGRGLIKTYIQLQIYHQLLKCQFFWLAKVVVVVLVAVAVAAAVAAVAAAAAVVLLLLY